MGLFSRNRDVATTPAAPSSTLGRGDVIPAAASNIVNMASEFYKQNPNLVHGIGLVASAILLNRMRRPR